MSQQLNIKQVRQDNVKYFIKIKLVDKTTIIMDMYSYESTYG